MGLKIATDKDFRTAEKYLILVDDKNPAIGKSFPVVENLDNLCLIMKDENVKQLAMFLAENYL